MCCYLNAKTVGITHFLKKSYKNTYTQKTDTQLCVCIFYIHERDLTLFTCKCPVATSIFLSC